MQRSTIIKNGKTLVQIESQAPEIHDLQSAMDLMASLWGEENCPGMIINRAAVTPDFFDLRTGLAGEVMQKFVNYHLRLAICGDFSDLTANSKALHDFIYESNKGQHIYFAADTEDAAEWLLRYA